MCVPLNSGWNCTPQTCWRQRKAWQSSSGERAPADALVLARSPLDDCHAFRWREHVWGVQFHPEFSGTHMRGYVRARHDALAREGHCAKQVSRNVTAAPHARRVLRRFVRHARHLRHVP